MEQDPKTGMTLQESIVELYLDVKIRSNDEVYLNILMIDR